MAHGTVLQVVQPPDGGVAEHVTRLSTGLAGRGWRVVVVTTPRSAVADDLRRAGIEVRLLDMDREPRPSDLVAVRGLRDIDRDVAPDVVHAHSSKAGALARLGLPRAARHVYTPHCPAFLSGLSTGRRLTSQAIEQAAVTRSGAIVAVCDWERRELSRRLAGAERRLAVVRHGVAAPGGEGPDRRITVFAAGRPVAGLVSVMRPQKDPLALVRAGAALDAAQGCVVLVGDGEMAAVVDREIARLRASDRVLRLSYGGSMGPPIAALDLFVLPSLWEAFPIAVLEALRSGVPVLGTTVGGVPEAVIPGLTGALVAPGDDVALAGALRELLAEPQRLRALGAAAAQDAARRYSLTEMVAATEALYDERIRATGGRPPPQAGG